MGSQYAEDIATIKANTGHIIKGLDELKETVGEERDKREALGNRVTALEGRVSIWQAGQAAFTAIAAAIAAAIGRSN